MRLKSYAYSFDLKENSKQNGIQKSPKKESCIISLFNSQTTAATNYSIRAHTEGASRNLTVQKKDKLECKISLNPFDDKRMYLNPTQSLHGISTYKMDIVLVHLV